MEDEEPYALTIVFVRLIVGVNIGLSGVCLNSLRGAILRVDNRNANLRCNYFDCRGFGDRRDRGSLARNRPDGALVIHDVLCGSHLIVLGNGSIGTVGLVNSDNDFGHLKVG